MSKLHILVDMDAIVVDLLPVWLSRYNAEWDDNVQTADIYDYDTSKCVKSECGVKVFGYLNEPGLFTDLPEIPGAVKVLKRLHGDGHEITIVTAPVEAPTCHGEKAVWLKNHMPFLNRKDLIAAHKKHHVHGDVLIDDSPANLRDYRIRWPQAKTMAIGYPYNEVIRELVDVYADGHRDFEAAWDKIEQSILALASRDLT